MKKNELLSELVSRNYNVTTWAKEHNHSVRMVHHVVNRYTKSGSQKIPIGQKSYRILCDLSATIGRPVIPGLFVDTAKQEARHE